MTTAGDILNWLNTLAPQTMKMDWDNVGLLCGSKADPVEKVLVALDPFEDVAQEAADAGAQLILTHHPLIFSPLPNVTDETSIGRTVMKLCRHGICAINAHTNLDVAPGGVNDTLAKTLGLENIQIIAPEGTQHGLLRKGSVQEQSLQAFLAHVKQALGCPGLRYAGDNAVRYVAVGGGACAGGLLDAFNAGCDTFVTADVKYNQFWDARDLGMNIIDAGHFYTENPVVSVLAEKIRCAFPEIAVEISKKHSDCMKFY